MSGDVRIEREQAVAEIVLNRPHRRNAFTVPMARELLGAIGDVSADAGIHALLLRGEGGALCSGLDLTEFGADPPPPWLNDWRPVWTEIQVALYRCPVPIVTALERFAINGGGPLVNCADLVVAGETAFLQVGEVRQGTSPAMNVAWLLLRHGEATAARMALTGDRVSGPELLRLGIASEVVPDDRVLDRARELARAVASYQSSGVRGIKATYRGLGGVPDPEAYFGRAFDWLGELPRQGTPRV